MRGPTSNCHPPTNMSTKTKSEPKAEPKRDVLVEVIQRGGVRLPCSTHRLGVRHRAALTQEEADKAVSNCIVKIIGIA